MPIVSALFHGEENATKEFTLRYLDWKDPTIDYSVTVYKKPPPSSITDYVNYYSPGDHRLHLSGGVPDAFETIKETWGRNGNLHRFEWDDTAENPQHPGWYAVRHFWNCDPNLRDPDVNDNSIIHFDGGSGSSAHPNDPFPADVEYIAKSYQIVSDMGARSLKQLVECVAQINEISTGLLPAMIKETQKTHVALDRLQKRANGKLPLKVPPDPLSCLKPERKSHPGHQ